MPDKKIQIPTNGIATDNNRYNFIRMNMKNECILQNRYNRKIRTYNKLYNNCHFSQVTFLFNKIFFSNKIHCNCKIVSNNRDQ